MSTTISWVKNVDGSAGETWNPTVGCTPAGEGCVHCYAKAVHTKRHGAWKRACAWNQSIAGEGPNDAGMLPRYADFADTCPPQYHKPFSEIQCLPERLGVPFHKRKPTTFFVDSMSDLFHPDVPEEFIAQVWATMWQCGPSSWLLDDPLRSLDRCHTFMVLTKRPERMREILASPLFKERLEDMTCSAWPDGWPVHPHIWLGVSASTQVEVNRLVPILLDIPAAVRFVSLEPLVERIDLVHIPANSWVPPDSGNNGLTLSALHGGRDTDTPWCLDWVIAGCESGKDRRHAEVEWFRSLRDQCLDAGVPYFLKQMEWGGKLVKDPLLDGRQWLQMPERG